MPASPACISSFIDTQRHAARINVHNHAATFGSHTHPWVTGNVTFHAIPTNGLSERKVGTAWRCMFEPIKARLASSCSKNGIKACCHRHNLTRWYVHMGPLSLVPYGQIHHSYAQTIIFVNWPLSSIGESLVQSQCPLLQSLINIRFHPSLYHRLLYDMGFLRKPNSLVFSITANELIKPMFGPSGFQSDTHDHNGFGVRHGLQSLRSRVKPPGPNAETRRLWWFLTTGCFGP